MGRFRHRLIDPFVIAIVFVAAIWIALMLLGKLYLAVFDETKDVDRIDRPELWIGVGIIVGILALMAFLVSRPEGSVGMLDKSVAIGSRPFYEESLPAVNPEARLGLPGAISDIQEGYRLYASSGELATVRGVLPGGQEYGKTFSGFLYAEGVQGVSDELWIPLEAVTSVYPESRSAFLAIKGDETEYFGWNTPPETVSRGPVKHMSAADKVKDPTLYGKKQ